MWHADVKWQSDEIRAFSSAMLYFSSDKDMPERTFFFPGTNRISHLRHFKGMRQAPEVRKSQEMVPGPAAPPLPHLQHPWCITATTTDYLSFGSLPPLLGRMNNTA